MVREEQIMKTIKLTVEDKCKCGKDACFLNLPNDVFYCWDCLKQWLPENPKKSQLEHRFNESVYSGVCVPYSRFEVFTGGFNEAIRVLQDAPFYSNGRDNYIIKKLKQHRGDK